MALKQELEGQVKLGNLTALKELLSLELDEATVSIRKLKNLEQIVYHQGVADTLERYKDLLINAASF